MSFKAWQQWGKRPFETEVALADRARGVLPEMESTKQLVGLVSKVYQPGMKILDVGCNAGHYLRGLRILDPKMDYTGVDAYKDYIEQAKSIFGNDRYAHFEVKDVLEPLFPNNPFDIVFSCNLIQHLPDFRLPVRNLLASTTRVCFIRTLLGDNTTVVKRAITQKYDDEGEPLDYKYLNTWQSEYFVEFVKHLGWNIELIDDQFDVSVLQKEYETVKHGHGSRVVDGMQADGNIIFKWSWAKITPI